MADDLGRAMLVVADGEVEYLAYVGNLPGTKGKSVVKIMSKFLKTPYKSRIFYVAYTQKKGRKQLFESDVCYSRIGFGKCVARIFREYRIEEKSKVILS